LKLASSQIRIDDDKVFRDDQGRQVMFHGTNVVVKVAPYLPNQGSEFDVEMGLND
jgi:hypothetical protein